MIDRFNSWIQSSMVVGQGVFPYVGVVLIICVVIAAVIVLGYLLFRVSKRLPGYVRYIFWRLMVLFRRAGGYFRRRKESELSEIVASFGNSGQSMPMIDSFRREGRRNLLRAAHEIRRPDGALVLLLGPTGAGKSFFAATKTAGGSCGTANAAVTPRSPDAVWWRLSDGWLLEIAESVFSDGNGARFDKILEILKRLDPERPLDGMTLLFPANKLLQSQSASEWRYGKAYHQIVESVGYRVPVDVVISRTDSVAGFTEFATAMDRANLAGEILGYSCHTPGEVLTAAEAMGQTVSKGERALLRLLLQSDGVAVKDPVEWCQAAKLTANLPILTDRIQALFHSIAGVSKQAPDNVLRSLSFCGLIREIGSGGRQRLAFADKLFESVLLRTPEALVPAASLVAAHRRLQQRYLRSAFILATLVVLWGAYSFNGIQRNVAVRVNALDSLDHELRHLRQAEHLEQFAGGPDLLRRVFVAAVRVDESSLRYVLIPASWGGGLDKLLQGAFGDVVQHFLFLPFIERLAHEEVPNQDGLQKRVRLDVMLENEPPSVKSMMEFMESRERLFSFVDSTDRFVEKQRMTYAQLMQLLGFQSLQLHEDEFDVNASMPSDLLQRLHLVSALRQETETRTRVAFDAAWQTLLIESVDQNPVSILLDEIADVTGRIANGNRVSLADIRVLAVDLKRLKQEIESKFSRRLLGTDTESEAIFAPVLARLASSSAIPVSQSVELTTALKSRVKNVRLRLAQKEIGGLGLVFVADSKDGRLGLTPEFKHFLTAYQAFAQMAFMQPVREVSSPIAGPTEVVDWSSGALDPLRGLSDQYKDFVSTSSQSFEPRLRSGMLRVARTNYEHHIQAVIKDSAQVTPSSDHANDLKLLAVRSTNLVAASKLFRAALGLDTTSQDSSEGTELLAREARKLLAQLEVRLTADDPLAALASDLVRWLRTAPPGVPLAATLKGDLKERSASIRGYLRSQYGALVGSLLDVADWAPSIQGDEQIARWRRFRNALDSFEKGNASGSALEFERTVALLDKMGDADKCERFFNNRTSSINADDYFSRALDNLENLLAATCDFRVADAQRRRYEEFSGWFNTVVAGRYPFASEVSMSGRTNVLSYDGFKRVLLRYQEVKGGHEFVFDANETRGAVGGFVRKMNRLSQIFIPSPVAALGTGATQLSGAAAGQSRETLDGEGVVRGKLRFRSKRQDERGAEHVADWILVIGGRRYTPRQGEPIFEWRPGESIELRLRWATNSPFMPVSQSAAGAGVSEQGIPVSEKWAVFKFSGPWALFDLVSQHHDTHGYEPAKLDLLFSVPVTAGQEQQDALVSISLGTVDGLSEVVPTFPGEAPRLGANGGWR